MVDATDMVEAPDRGIGPESQGAIVIPPEPGGGFQSRFPRSGTVPQVSQGSRSANHPIARMRMAIDASAARMSSIESKVLARLLLKWASRSTSLSGNKAPASGESSSVSG